MSILNKIMVIVEGDFATVKLWRDCTEEERLDWDRALGNVFTLSEFVTYTIPSLGGDNIQSELMAHLSRPTTSLPMLIKYRS